MPNRELPLQAVEHLEQIADAPHRQSVADRLGQISVLHEPPNAFEHYSTHDLTAEEVVPFGQTARTEQLMTNIAKRARETSRLTSESREQHADEPSGLWDAILASELHDIAEAKQKGDQQKVEDLVVEHMVSLELAPTGSEYHLDRHRHRLGQRAQQSILQLSQMGLAETTVHASRNALGLVVTQMSEPGFSFKKKNGQPIAETHGIQSVAHTFAKALPALEVGLGKGISLDPAEAAFAERSASPGDIQKLSAMDAAVAASVRVAETQVKGETPEDKTLVTSLCHRALERLRDGDDSYFMYGSANDGSALVALASANPNLTKSAEYDADFARLRQVRSVNSRYRGNNSAVPRLDSDIIHLVDNGQTDLAKRLITASDAEIVNPKDPEYAGVLPTALEFTGADTMSVAHREERVAQMQKIQREKAADLQLALTNTLGQLPIGQDSQNLLRYTILRAHDPESALHSVHIFQEALSEDDRVTAEQLVRQLAEEMGGGNSTVLDEVSVHAETLAPILLSKEFRALSGDHDFGAIIRNQIVRYPESIERIVSTFENPVVKILMEKHPGSRLIVDAFMDASSERHVVARLSMLESVADELNYDELYAAAQNDDMAEFVHELASGDNLHVLNELPAEERRLIVQIGLASSPAEQANILKNLASLDAPIFALFQGGAYVSGVESMVWRTVLTAYNLDTRAQELHQALTDSQLLPLLEHQGPAYEFGHRIMQSVIKADGPGAVALQARELIDAAIPNLQLIEAAAPTFDIAIPLRNALVSLEDSPERARQFNALIAESNLLAMIGHEGPAYGFGRTLLDPILKAKNPEQAFLALSESIRPVLPTIELLQEAKISGEAIAPVYRAMLLGELSLEEVGVLHKAFAETEFLDLIGHEGPAHGFGGTLVKLVMNADKPYEMAQQIRTQMLSNDPLWLHCYKISQLGLGSIEDVGYQTGLSVTEIPLSLPAPNLIREQQAAVLRQEASRPTPFGSMSPEQKRAVADLEGMSDEQVGTLQDIAFDKLRPEYKQALLAFRLFETITLSRDPAEHQRATERNRLEVQQGDWLQPGDLVHATGSVAGLRAILGNGALAGEARGFQGKTDSYPFNLDTVVVSPDVSSQQEFAGQVRALKNSTYGEILVVFGRGPEALHSGEEFPGGMNEDHRLVLGGLPASEVSSIILRDTNPLGRDETLPVSSEIIETAKRIVTESDVYIPVIGPDGSLLLNYEEYDRLQIDGNLRAVRPEMVDNAFERPNSQAGSNEAAEFLVPRGGDQEPERWYVKFGDDNPDRLWTEVLADKFYEAVDPSLVAETKAVIVEGRLARASRMIPPVGSTTAQDRNKGFVVDAYLGNWDAVYNPENIGPGGIRYDTGNAWDYLARGEKKLAESFNEVVRELEVGADRSRLGLGMRQMYPDLTDQEIRQQVTALETALPDATIDRLVDSVRLPSSQRDHYRNLARARRDYIIGYFNASGRLSA